MRASLAQLHQRLGVTTVYVTHDQIEAMTLGQRVAVMRDGQHPPGRHARSGSTRGRATSSSPAFIGSPAMNLVEATVDGDEVRFGQFRVAARRPATARRAGERVVLGIRPESFEDAAFAPGLPTIEVGVEVLEELGSDAHVFFHVDAPPITAEVARSGRRTSGLLPADRALFTARVDAAHVGARRAGGSSSRSTPQRFHFFDPESGARLATAAAAPSCRPRR